MHQRGHPTACPRLVAALAVTLVSLAVRAGAQTAADSTAVAQVVTSFHEALAGGDTATVRRLLAADAVILESGDLETREHYLAHHLPADIAFLRAVPNVSGPIRVVMVGEAAWATSSSRVVGTFEGRAINSQGVELVVLTRVPDAWQIRAIHWSSRSRRG